MPETDTREPTWVLENFSILSGVVVIEMYYMKIY